jgi:hypothetical protein
LGTLRRKEHHLGPGRYRLGVENQTPDNFPQLCPTWLADHDDLMSHSLEAGHKTFGHGRLSGAVSSF